jgi:hypothetical protein
MTILNEDNKCELLRGFWLSHGAEYNSWLWRDNDKSPACNVKIIAAKACACLYDVPRWRTQLDEPQQNSHEGEPD